MDLPKKMYFRRQKRSPLSRWLYYIKRQKFPMNEPSEYVDETPIYDIKGKLICVKKIIGKNVYYFYNGRLKRMKHDDPNYKKPTSYDDHENWFDYRTPKPNVVNIVSRSGWGAQEVEDLEPLSIPVLKVMLFYTNTDACFTRQECVNEMQKIQKYFISERNVPDIPYNFLIGTDGDVYEGRGWTTKPTKMHTEYRFRQKSLEKTIDIAYIGPFKDFQKDPTAVMDHWPKKSFLMPMNHMLEALMHYGCQNNYLRRDVRIVQ